MRSSAYLYARVPVEQLYLRGHQFRVCIFFLSSDSPPTAARNLSSLTLFFNFSVSWLPLVCRYGRMGPAARYALHLASGLVLLQAGRHQRAEQELFLATSLHPEPHGVKDKMRINKGLASASSLTAVSVSFIFIFKLLVLMPMLAAVMLPRLRRRLRALRWWGHTAACVFWLLLWWCCRRVPCVGADRHSGRALGRRRRALEKRAVSRHERRFGVLATPRRAPRAFAGMRAHA